MPILKLTSDKIKNLFLTDFKLQSPVLYVASVGNIVVHTKIEHYFGAVSSTGDHTHTHNLQDKVLEEVKCSATYRNKLIFEKSYSFEDLARLNGADGLEWDAT